MKYNKKMASDKFKQIRKRVKEFVNQNLQGSITEVYQLGFTEGLNAGKKEILEEIKNKDLCNCSLLAKEYRPCELCKHFE